MNDSLTLDDLNAPLRALRLLSVDYGHLPAPSVRLSPIFPDLLELSFHRDLGGFEQWREALNIAPEDVVHHVHDDRETGTLEVDHPFAGARLRLIAFMNVPARELAVAGAGGGS